MVEYNIFHLIGGISSSKQSILYSTVHYIYSLFSIILFILLFLIGLSERISRNGVLKSNKSI